MPDGEIRQIQIRGDAVAAYTKEKKTRRTTRRTRDERPQEGGDVVPGPQITRAANYARAANITKQLQAGGAPLSATTPPPVVAATPAVAAAAAMRTLPLLAGAVPTVPVSSGGEAPMQKTTVESQAGGCSLAPMVAGGCSLAPMVAGGSGSAKLVLAPAKSKTRKSLVLTPPGKRATKAPTKGTRKIRMQLAGLKKRLTRSRDISKESREKPVEVIRQELVAAKLIREKSTVPEPVMRDIWRDYQTLRGRAL